MAREKYTISIEDQNGLRQSINTYIAETGVTARFISRQCGMCETIFSHYRKGRMQLSDKHFVALMNYLMKWK